MPFVLGSTTSSGLLQDKCRAVHDWDTKYVLYSVLVHSGGAFGGHYYAYVRPNNGDQWVKFNDSVVTEVQKREVLQVCPRLQLLTSLCCVFVQILLDYLFLSGQKPRMFPCPP